VTRDRNSDSGFDRLLTAALSDESRKRPDPAACPLPGDLAALIEGTLDSAERQNIETMRPFARVAKPRSSFARASSAGARSFSGAAEAVRRFSPSPLRSWLRWLVPATAALATAALIYLVVVPTWQSRQAATVAMADHPQIQTTDLPKDKVDSSVSAPVRLRRNHQ